MPYWKLIFVIINTDYCYHSHQELRPQAQTLGKITLMQVHLLYYYRSRYYNSNFILILILLAQNPNIQFEYDL